MTAGGRVKIRTVFIRNKVCGFSLSLFHSSNVSYLNATRGRFDHSNVYHLILHRLVWRGVEVMYFLINGIIVPTAM
jgi:hypothetical protein